MSRVMDAGGCCIRTPSGRKGRAEVSVAGVVVEFRPGDAGVRDGGSEGGGSMVVPRTRGGERARKEAGRWNDGGAATRRTVRAARGCASVRGPKVWGAFPRARARSCLPVCTMI